MNTKIITRIKMWYHANLVYFIRKITNRKDWVNSEDDAIRKTLAKHTKRTLNLAEQLGYELSDKGLDLVKEL